VLTATDAPRTEELVSKPAKMQAKKNPAEAGLKLVDTYPDEDESKQEAD